MAACVSPANVFKKPTVRKNASQPSVNPVDGVRRPQSEPGLGARWDKSLRGIKHLVKDAARPCAHPRLSVRRPLGLPLLTVAVLGWVMTGSALADPTPPSNGNPPSISGGAVVGGILTADPGTWTGDDPITYSYQWSDGGTDSTDTALRGGCRAVHDGHGHGHQRRGVGLGDDRRIWPGAAARSGD